MSATHQQKHEAGRHLVVAEALLRGYDAHTVGRSGLVDVNGHRAEVHVKTKGAWQIANLDRFAEGSTGRVVFVDLSGTVPEFFILNGEQARAMVRRDFEQWLAGVGGRRPRTPGSKHTAFGVDRVQRWRNRWSLFD